MSAEAFARKWHDHLLSTEPVDHAEAEAAVRAAYRAAGMPEPERFLWCASPAAAALAALVLIGTIDGYNHAVLEDVERSKAGKARTAAARAEVAERLGIGADEVEGYFGKPLYRAEGSNPITKALQANITEAWMARAEAGDDYLANHARGPFKPLHDLEQALHFEGYKMVAGEQRGSLLSDAVDRAGPKPLGIVAKRSAHHRMYGSFAYSEVALDQALAEAGKFEPTELQRAMWAAYEACGMWWPCDAGVIFAERPVAAELAPDGPRLAWADGFAVGGALPAQAAPPPPPSKAPTPPKTGILSADLPRDHRERLALLRSHGAALPYLDRYLAGEHAQVWAELVALGEAALADEHVADALAVAYETMTRVERNVRTLAERLAGLDYRFVDPASSGGLFGLRKPKVHSPHVPPRADSAKLLAELERTAGGPVPLSLRAFFDVVGEVNFVGEHPTLAPRGSSDADPLFVYGVQDATECVEGWDEDEEDRVMAVIAPDAFHKANISGGEAYMIALPVAAADAPLEEEPHDVTFVEYLRIAILGWGGLPGWDQAEDAPREELDRLREGLLPF